MLKTLRFLLATISLSMGVVACSPVIAEVSYPPPMDRITPTPSPTQTMTIIDPRLILTPGPLMKTLTPAEAQLQATRNAPPPTPNAYCYQPPEFLLPVSDTQGLNEDQIAKKLVELFLSYYHTPQAPDECRVVEYCIDDVHYNEQYSTLPLDPKGDFMREVYFSVKLPLVDNHPHGFWVSLGAIESDQQDWFHTGAHVAIFRFDSGYTMQFAYP